MRLIDADKLLDTLGIDSLDCEKCSWGNFDYCKRGSDFVEACSAIEDAPTVDAEPIRHGHWMKRSKVYPGLPYDHTYHYECSNCGCMDTAGEDVEVPYCWHCGAKMGEVEEDDNIDPYMYPCTMCEDFDGKGGCMSKDGCGERREDAETKQRSKK